MHGYKRTGLEGCKQCKANRGVPTQCNNCDEPALFKENIEAVNVFWHCSTQWRASMSGVFGLDYTALNSVMDFLAVKNKKTCFKKIRILESEQLSILHGDKD